MSQFCYIKLGYNGEYITLTCYRDVEPIQDGVLHEIAKHDDIVDYLQHDNMSLKFIPL